MAISQNAMAIKVDVFCIHNIKPSSPTPHHLKSFKFSIWDQLAASIYTPVVLFYQAVTGDEDASRSQQLKSSLSEVLVPFHPLAGRINGNISIDCNDDGVPYLEAHVGCCLHDILVKPDPKMMKQFLPISLESKEPHIVPLLIQANLFKCGGIAIGVCASHKIADAATLSTFINAWAITAFGNAKPVFPEFVIASLFPARDSLNSLTVSWPQEPEDLETKRYVFDASSIAALKIKAKSDGALQPTRVEAVSALIWKCAMTASRSTSMPKKLPSVMFQAVNMRKRLVPPLPENSIGNFAAFYVVHEDEGEGEGEIELGGLVGEFKKRFIELCDKIMKKFQGSGGILGLYKEAGAMLKREDIDCYKFSSWCGFHLYDADFGWGKPTWVGIALWPYKNAILLMDTKEGDGIEAWVNLKDEDMVAFEQDQELLAFASPNPGV